MPSFPQDLQHCSPRGSFLSPGFEAPDRTVRQYRSEVCIPSHVRTLESCPGSGASCLHERPSVREQLCRRPRAHQVTCLPVAGEKNGPRLPAGISAASSYVTVIQPARSVPGRGARSAVTSETRGGTVNVVYAGVNGCVLPLQIVSQFGVFALRLLIAELRNPPVAEDAGEDRERWVLIDLIPLMSVSSPTEGRYMIIGGTGWAASLLRRLSGTGTAVMPCLLASCSQAPERETPVGTAAAALTDPGIAPFLAYPEYDLTVPVNWWWMHDAVPTTIQARIDAGHRLISMSAIPTDPGVFAASFVENAGLYYRSGNELHYDLTEAGLLALDAEAGKRVADIAPYSVRGQTRFAAVVLDNTGTQETNHTLVLGVTWDALDAQRVGAFGGVGGRIMDIEQHGTDGSGEPLYYCVLIEQSGVNARDQLLRENPDGDSRDSLFFEMSFERAGWRIVDVVDGPGTPNEHLRWIREQKLSDDERSWWVEDLRYLGLDETENSDSIVHNHLRVGGRYVRLKPQVDPATGQVTYRGVMTDAAALPTNGSHLSSTALDEVDATLRRLHKDYGLPALSAAVMKDGRLVFAHAYGYSEVGSQRPVEPTDMFRIASVSKVITGAAILRLIEDGVICPISGQPLTLETHPFGEIFTYSPPAESPNLGELTVKGLLGYRSGFHQTLNSAFLTVGSLIAREQAGDPAYPVFANPPDSADPHNNQDYVVLGSVVGAFGGTLEQYVRQGFLTPLGIRRIGSTVTPNGSQPDPLHEVRTYTMGGLYLRQRNAGKLYPPEDEPPHHGEWLLGTLPQGLGTGGFAASPIDLVRWAASLDGSRPGFRSLSEGSWQEILSQPGSFIFHDEGDGSLCGGYPCKDGYLPNTTVAVLRMVPSERLIYAWAASSDSMMVGNLRDDLCAPFEALEGQALPEGDLHDEYFEQPCYPNFHNLPADQFQYCFDWWGDEAGMQTVTADPSGTRVSGSFLTGLVTATHALIPWERFDQEAQSMDDVGLFPHHMSVVTPNGVPLVNVIWKTPAGPIRWTPGETPEDFQALFDEMWDQHYVNTDIFAYESGGLKVGGAWVQRPHDGTKTLFGLTPSAFWAENTTNQAAGREPVHVVPYRFVGALQYAAIWESVAEDYDVTVDTSGDAYQITHDQRYAEGWTLHQLHAFDGDSFAAVWHKGTLAQQSFNFEDASGYSVINGTAGLGSTPLATQGQSGLLVSGSSYFTISTPNVNTTDVRSITTGGVPTQAYLDVFIAPGQPNPHYMGAVQLYADFPQQDQWNQFAAQVDLTGLPQGVFSTLRFAIRPELRTLLGRSGQVHFKWALNIPAGTPPCVLDNLRFY